MRTPSALALLAMVLLLPPATWAQEAAGARPSAGSGPGATALPEAALDHLYHGRPLEAWTLLLDGLRTGLPACDPADTRTALELEAATWVLADVVGRLGNWEPTLDALLAMQPWPAEAPPDALARLDLLAANCLRRTGHSDRARGVIERLGFVSDWYLVGPFDNERGSGMRVAYEPERVFDRQAEMPGKERPVRWRQVAGRHHPLAVVGLDAMLRPSQQAVAYLATAVRPRDAGPVEIRIGSTDPYRLIHDGKVVAERSAERPLVPDQDRHLLVLHEGWNQLLVKLGNGDDEWAFTARFTDLEGRPYRWLQCESMFAAWPHEAPSEDEAALIEYGVEPERRGAPESGWASAAAADAAAAATARADDAAAATARADDAADDADAATAGARIPPALLPGTPERLAALGDASAWRLLALYHLLIHPEDDVDESVVRAAERAVEAEPDSVLGRYLLAQACRPRGRSRNEVDANRRLHALQDVVELDPQHVAALIDLANFWLRDNPIPSRAQEYSARAVEAAPTSWTTLQLRAEVLESEQRAAEADLLRQQAEASDAAQISGDGQLARARRLDASGLQDVALDTLRRGAAGDVLHRPLVDELVRRLADAGEMAELIRVTDAVLRAEPFELRRMLASASFLERSTDAVARARGRELVQQALEVCPEHIGALQQRVRFDERAGDLDSAAAGLREVLRLQPTDEPARRHLELLTEGEEQRFEDPYRWDATLLADLPLPDSAGNDPLEALRRTVVWRVEPDGKEHSYQHVALRVLTEGGARLLDVYPVYADSGSRLHVHGVRVVRPDGTTENAPAPRGTRDGTRRFDLPPLRPGDMVDVEYRVDQLQTDVFGEAFDLRHGFYPDRIDGLAPTRLSELVVLTPPGVELAIGERHTEGLERSVETAADGTTIRRWVARDLVRPPLESAMPQPVELLPLVDISTFRDWDQFADWWWHFIEKEFATTPAMSAKVVELTAGKASEMEKIEAIARFVGQEIRYNAWAFGTHGYEPYSAPTIFERRFGDCKDKSILLRQLLAEIGVEAVPVLLRAESPRTLEPLDVAMVGHFNHCIAYLPEAEGRPALYLDATADLNPLEYLREDDQGARVLHVGPEGGSVQSIPYAPAEANTLRRAYDVRLAADGDGVVSLTDTSNGSFGVRLRQRFGGEDDDPGESLTRWLSSKFGGLQVLDLQTSDLHDIGTPARLDARFEAVDLWASQGGLQALPVTFEQLGLEQVAIEAPGSRHYDLVFPCPFAQHTSILYRLPEGGVVASLPSAVIVDEPGLLHYELQVQASEVGVAVERHFQLSRARIPRERYAGFRDALDRIRQAEARSILLQLDRAP